MSEKKPVPLGPEPKGKICPVCGKRTYSQGGIHPQCAVDRADSERTETLKEERNAEATKAKPSNWRMKQCPKCKTESHVRRKVCDCGYVFF